MVNELRSVRIVALAGSLAVASSALIAQGSLQYPQTRKVDHVDTYHGT